MASHPLVLNTAVQVRLHWTLNDADAYNVLGGIVGGGYINSQAHADALDTAVKGHLTSSGLKALLASTTSLVSAAIRDVRTPHEVEYVGSGGALAGTGGGDPLPNEIAAVVTLRTAKAGRSFRGRTYIGGAIKAESDATGHIVAAFNTALAAFMTGVQADMAAEGITLAVLSRPRYDPVTDVLTYAGTITPVIAIVMRDTLWDSQRRRKS